MEGFSSRLGPLQAAGMHRLGIGHQLPSLMRVVGVALGGRFELPNGGMLIGLRCTPKGVELKLEVLLAALPDLPGRFLDLYRAGSPSPFRGAKGCLFLLLVCPRVLIIFAP